jgi:hypothetical protein
MNRFWQNTAITFPQAVVAAGSNELGQMEIIS